jgi:hypothetical protein
LGLAADAKAGLVHVLDRCAGHEARTVMTKSCKRASQVRLIRAIVAATSLTPNRSAISSPACAPRRRTPAVMGAMPGDDQRGWLVQVEHLAGGRPSGPVRRPAAGCLLYELSARPTACPMARANF